MADASDQYAVGSCRQIDQSLVAIFTSQARQPHLDKLVVMQGALCFGNDAIADTGIADQDDGFERMGEAAQVPALFFGKLHPLIVPFSVQIAEESRTHAQA